MIINWEKKEGATMARILGHCQASGFWAVKGSDPNILYLINGVYLRKRNIVCQT